MAAVKPPHEQLLELAIFAPLGIALAVRDRFPELAAEGRAELDRQVRAARMIGTFAVAQAKREIDRRLAARAPSPARPAAETSQAQATARSSAPQTASAQHPAAHPIADYDTLTAAEVVKALPGLSAGDRALVAEYEQTHRNRRTILGRLEQLGR